MTSHGNGTRDRPTVLLFTWAAGGIDAISYLAAHVFTANMTGNTVLLGISIGQGKAGAVLRALVAMVAFIAGIISGAVLAGEGGDKARTVAAVRREVMVEAGLLALFAAAFLLPLPKDGDLVTTLLIVLSAVAMGLQSAAVKRLHLPGIATTYITGTITSLFTGLVHHWSQAKPLEPPPSGGAPRMKMNRFLVLQAEVFLSYAVAALATGALYTRWPALVAWLPAIAIATVAVLMRMRPPAS
jgi:uncharacterized membrane protein YoaK (UPF0700 family)